MVRLQKMLAQAGVASRRGAEELIAQGGVSVNGKVVTTLGVQIDEKHDRVEVRGRRVMKEDPLYRILLKPRQCLSSLSRPSADKRVSAEAPRPTLTRYVSDRELGWQVVAPLDFLSEGVILLTTDGALAERMSRGGGRVPMTYHLKLQGALGESALTRLERGWSFNGRPVRPSKVEVLATTGKNTWIEMIVPESRPRALKAAGEAIHHQLLKISRVRLGVMSFEGLKMGGWRDLTKGEINALRSAAASFDVNPGGVPLGDFEGNPERVFPGDFEGNPERVSKPSRAPAPAGKARFRPRDFEGNPERVSKPFGTPPASPSRSLRSASRDGRVRSTRGAGAGRVGPSPHGGGPAPAGKARFRPRDK